MNTAPIFPALLLLTACADFQLEVEPLEEVGSILQVSWTTDQPGSSWVEYGYDGLELVTPTSEGEDTEHEFMLLGLPFLTDVDVRAYTDVGGRILSTRSRGTTLGRPSTLPKFTVNVYDEEAMDDASYLAGAAMGLSQCLFAIRRDGTWVWYHEESEEVQIVEADFLDGTNHIIYNTFNMDRSVDESQLHVVSWDKTHQESIRTPLGHHSFTQLPDGSLAYLSLDVRSWDIGNGEMEDVVGDVIKVIPPDGEEYTLFSVWDVRDPDRDELQRDGVYVQGVNWSHANALTYQELTDSLVISFRNLLTIMEVDWPTGEVILEFGPEGDYRVSPDSEQYKEQHDPHFLTPDTMVMTSTTDVTKGVEYELDHERMVLNEVWSYAGDEEIVADVQGQILELDNGNRLVNFGSGGLLKEVTPDGRLVWELRGQSGVAFGHVMVVDDLYSAE